MTIGSITGPKNGTAFAKVKPTAVAIPRAVTPKIPTARPTLLFLKAGEVGDETLDR